MGEGEKKERGEEEVVVMDGLEEEEAAAGEEGEGGMRWGKFLRRMPVRVLLVEGDDSTRQIIAALLRKCSYIVVVASDGIKAWETLNEKSYSIDLVLTEVELPLMSGFGLLTMIMDHGTCKNIPVIMMSSDDSISMVFKCMLKGAADFLVKPIRRNELRNLWQHVWRRQISSCTRSNMEAESKHVHIMECEPQTARHKPHVVARNAKDLTRLDSLLSVQQPKHQAMSRNEDFIPRGLPYHNDSIVEKASKEVEDLLRGIDNQPKNMDTPREGDALHNSSQANNIKCLSSPLVHLELSLRRFEYSGSSKQENDERNTLNHSSSSAFSMYNNRIFLASNVANDAPGCSISTPNMNLEDTNSTSTGVVGQDGTAVRCTPIRVVPLPISIGGMPCDSLVNGKDPLMRSLCCPGSARYLWSSTQSMLQEVKTQTNSSDHSDPDNVNSKQAADRYDQSVRSPSYHSIDKQDVGLLTEQEHASAKGENGSSSLCDGARISLDANAHGSIFNGARGQSNAPNTLKTIPKDANSESNSREGPHQAELHCLSPREVALNKFRLKRKDRCFEKKVRYQRRKILAEQRPRVKGQFVRQEQLVSQGMGVDCHRNDSANR
ncbi:two-component response regulator-like PRR95 isoform X2 [Typha angustifolia]|uniref:two-component response regulator-like PRR95 isoform X2 n=1 Tax=Typha angustifolia TaxID=59011 RepID=UPI003C2D839F